MRSAENKSFSNLLVLVAFGIAFGYVEAAVVCYLRVLTKFHENYPLSRYHVYLNLGFITFVKPFHTHLFSHRIGDIEVARESATIVMLVCVAFLVASSMFQRLGAFMVGFACWDISYYGWLRILDNWPRSFLTRDVFFLIPVAWIGPVITPLVICAVMLGFGSWMYLHGDFVKRRAIYW